MKKPYVIEVVGLPVPSWLGQASDEDEPGPAPIESDRDLAAEFDDFAEARAVWRQASKDRPGFVFKLTTVEAAQP